MNEILYKINDKELFLEKTLVELDYPILYVCKDNNEKRYLAMCVDADDGYYLVADISDDVLIQMITERITMKDAFKNSRRIISVRSINNNIDEDVCNEVKFCNIPPEDLPSDGAYFKIKNDDINEYISFLNSLNVLKQYTFNKDTICYITNTFNYQREIIERYISSHYEFLKSLDVFKEKYFNFILSEDIDWNTINNFKIYSKESIHG